ncbi:MAG: META domain-containing protein [Caldilineaceae bacterium]
MRQHGIMLALVGVIALVLTAGVHPRPVVAASASGQSDTTSADGEEKTLYVGPTQADCVGVAPQLCLLVKEDPDADYTYFYSNIDGFTFVPGYEYELRVQVTPVENAPADASSLRYTLVEVVDQTEVGPTLENTDWLLTGMVDADGAMINEFAADAITATFADGSLSGNAGCNNYFTSYTVDGDALTTGRGGATMMACPEPVMIQEQTYLANLTAVTRYAIVGDELRLFDGGAQPLLTYVVRESTGLTGTIWEATGVNNGRGGVASLIIGSEITAVFDDEGNMGGSGGCNNYGAGYEVDGENITIGPARSTLMACAEPDGVMEQEQAYFQALANAAVFTIDGDRLQLRDADGALQVDFRAQAADMGAESPEIDALVAALPNLAYQNIAGMEDAPVQMTDGMYEGEPYVEGGAARPLAEMTNISATGSIDGVPSVAVIVYSSTGGSGGFNNLALVQNVDGTPTNVGTVLLGDRVAINALSIQEDQIVVDMVTQGPNDPMCCPTQQVLNTYAMVDGALAQTSSTILGFVSPGNGTESTVNIIGSTWEWVEFQSGDGSTLTVDNPTVYTLLLNDDATVAIQADCNYAAGTYNLNGSSLTIALGPMTMAMCPPDSLSDRYVRMLGDVVTYVVEDNVLYLNLKMDAGNMVFKPLGTTPDADEEAGTEQIQQALANMTYNDIAVFDGPVTLSDGEYEGEPAVAGAATRPVVTLTDWMAVGKLNGTPSAATILVSNGGGSGSFYDLAIVQEVDGEPTNVATTLLGDRVVIEALDIEENQVIVQMVEQGPGDAACCPTQRVLNAYQLEDGTLTQTTNAVIGYVDETSAAPTGDATATPTPTPAEEAPTTAAAPTATPTATPTEEPAAEATPAPEEEAVAADELAPATVTSDAVTLDPGTLAGSYHWRIMPTVPFAADMGPGQWGAPAHVLVTFDYAGPDDVMQGNDARWIAIYPVAAYRDQWDAQDDDTVATTLDALQSLLAEQPDAPEAPMPVLPPVPATNDLAVQPAYVDFGSGSGVRFVGRFVQAADPVYNGQLLYIYQGLTDDGRYLVSMQWPVTAAGLTDDPATVPTDDYATADAFEAYRAQVVDQLNGLSADEWTPSLDALDALVNSLTLSLP